MCQSVKIKSYRKEEKKTQKTTNSKYIVVLCPTNDFFFIVFDEDKITIKLKMLLIIFILNLKAAKSFKSTPGQRKNSCTSLWEVFFEHTDKNFHVKSLLS
jgi:hypothetical protein